MRDADDDEETRVFSASADVAHPSPKAEPSAPTREGRRLPPPLPNSLSGSGARADEAATDEAATDESATRLVTAGASVKQPKWLVSDGPKAPLDVTHGELCALLSSGKVSRAALAWQKGMREWQNVTEIPMLRDVLPPLSSPRASASPPPKRSSRPHQELVPRPSQPAHQRPISQPAAALAPLLSPKIDASESDTPPSGSLLYSTSVSTADFSEITPAQTPQSQRADRLASRSPLLQPERIEIKPMPASAATTPQREVEGAAKPKPSIHTPRPAAGRPPSPGEPVAKAPEELDAKVVINDPAAEVVATGLAQAKLNPTIDTHRETTQPTRARPPLYQLRAAGQPPNVVLWVLGAGGWVLSGVLAGLLIAQSNPDPVAPTATAPTITTTHAAKTTPAQTATPAATDPQLASKPEPAPAAPADTAQAALDAPAPTVPVKPTKPVLSKPPIASNAAASKPAVADPSGLAGPTTTKDINTPGF